MQTSPVLLRGINILWHAVLTFDLTLRVRLGTFCRPLLLICLFAVISCIPHVMTYLCVVMNRPECWSRSAGQQGAESCKLTLSVGLSASSAPPPPNHRDRSINALQAVALLLRSPSASLHSAYTRLTGLISKLHPAPRLQAAAAAREPFVELCSAPAGSVGLCNRHLPITICTPWR